jgi:capsular polysaccharide biosynthesis protein
MELNEVASRILGRHWMLIVIAVALGVGAAALLHRGDTKTYTASSRLVLDTADPQTAQESTSISDAAKAIATSPGQVSEALKNAHIRSRDPKRVADDHVSVRALGTSAVLQLSVSDRDPRTAAAISNALAAQVIRTRLDVGKGQVDSLVSGLDRKIATLNQKIAAADAAIALDARVAAGENGRRAAGRSGSAAANGVQSKDAQTSSDAQTLRDSLAQRRAALEAERVSLLSNDAARPKPSIISPATAPSDPDPSNRVPDMILGALLGLVMGVGLAGLFETIRPTMVGRDALAREFDTPLLGTLPGAPDLEVALQEATPIATRLGLAAKVTGARSVGLLAAGRPTELTGLAHQLEAAPAHVEPAFAGATGSPRPSVEGGGHDSHSAFTVRSLAESSSVNGGGFDAVVVVSPTALKKSEIIDTNHFLRASRLPVLGLITYRASRRGRNRWRPSRSANG